MGSQILSQDELNLLLNEVTVREDVPEPDRVSSDILTENDKTILAGTMNISMENAVESLSKLIKRPVNSSYPSIAETTWDGIKKSGIISPEHLAAQVSYVEGLKGDNFLIMKMHDAATMVDLMLGGEGSMSAVDLDDLKMSALGEVMNQMMGSSATAFSDIFGRKVIISTPTLKTANLYEEDHSFQVSEKMILAETLLTIALDEPVTTAVYQIIPIDNAIEMIESSRHGSNQETLAGYPGIDQAFQGENKVVQRRRESIGVQRPDERKFTVQPVQFVSLENGDSKKEGEVNKLDLIYDVGLQLTVELGRTEKTLKEVLEIGPGSIVGLEKLAGEPLDILVNGKILARGEVIVIDENYGVRIKEIINSGERIGGFKA
jgi:flagellar motor switch protein FliN/FliY